MIGNDGVNLLHYWEILCSDRKGSGKIAKLVRSAKSSTISPNSRAATVPIVKSSFLYKETSSSNYGQHVFCSVELRDVFGKNNMSFYFNRFSGGSCKTIGRFRIHLLSSDITWSTPCNIPKNDRYRKSSTDWTLVSLIFTVQIHER